MFQQIDKKKAHIDANRPLPKYTLKSLREKLMLEWTYNSNAIEGNTLTINETKVVLEGITVGGKTMHEHLEVLNHRDAIAYVEDIAYYEALDKAHTQNNFEDFIRLVTREVEDSLNLYLGTINQ